jgi:hypothetical protein
MSFTLLYVPSRLTGHRLLPPKLKQPFRVNRTQDGFFLFYLFDGLFDKIGVIHPSSEKERAQFSFRAVGDPHHIDDHGRSLSECCPT